MLDSPTPDRKATALILLAVAGFIDAVGLAETGRYFVSYMSGNTTQIGLLLAYHDMATLLLPLGLVALFVGGATVGTLIAEKAGRRASAVLLLAIAAVLGGAWWGLGSMRPMVGVTLLPIAMGMANVVTLRGGAADGGGTVGATYATGALVRLGVALAGLGTGRGGPAALYNLALWLALLCGSVVGAIGRLRYGNAALIGPVAVLLLLALLEFVRPRGRG